MKRMRGVVEVFKVISIVFLSAVIIRSFIFQPYVVEGSSMERSFHNGEYLFVEKLSYRLQEPKRGDVIVFRYPRDPRLNYIKRVVGLPGETIHISDGKVYVNGQQLKEQYLSQDTRTLVDNSLEATYEISLDSSQYFVMGDNRSHSSDSREWGPLTKRYIVGRSAAVLYPHSSFRAIASPKYN